MFQRLIKAITWRYYLLYFFFKKNIVVGKKTRIYGLVSSSVPEDSFLKIGDNVVIKSGFNLNPLSRNIRASIILEPGASISIGNNTGISSACIWAKTEIEIGDFVNIGADAIITDCDWHSLDTETRRHPSDDIKYAKSKKVLIGDDVLIGTRSIILKGTTLLNGVVVGAGAVIAGGKYSRSIIVNSKNRIYDVDH